ncbi:ABC transporter permease [Georgenia yuyongxinii]|uniref:ABC transporter permease n=1 Tax=Georgenia yuyongxinii TaxID=2589797 RepID=A0A5B8C3I7_9MICO|nr:ABC transporter permease [Georgenia yuyongxinii]QDC25094.1 ABC transporter permease [Georgenia yuyongxinii]
MVASELTKLRLRSTVVAMTVAVVLVVAVGAAMAIGVLVQEVPADGLADAPVGAPATAALTGVEAAVYAVAALGVIAVTGEFASRSIATTFAAVPRRSRVVLGKALAVGVLVLAVTLPAMLLTFAATQVILGRAGIAVSLADPGVLRAMVGAALYLTVVAVLAGGLGWLLRSTAGAYMVLIGVLVLVPALATLLPGDLAAAVLPYLPSAAGTAMMQLEDTGQLAPWVGFGVFVLYAVGTLVIAAAVVRRRDVR